MNHEGKCRSYHGHRYAFQFTLEADSLDSVGRVVDFGVVRSLLRTWLDARLDHAMILQKGDPLAQSIEESGSRLYLMENSPTIEHLVQLVFARCQRIVEDEVDGVRLLRVRGYETPNNWADFGGRDG